MNSKISKTLKIVGNVVLWLFVAFCALITVVVFSAQSSKSGLPAVFGKSMVNILTDSMTPTINPGDIIFAETIDTTNVDTLKINDVVVFIMEKDPNTQKNVFNTHRIVKIEEENGVKKYYTQGDKAGAPIDAPITAGSIVARWDNNAPLRGLGSVIGFLQTSLGFALIIVLPLAIFFLYEVIHVVLLIVRMKGNKVSKATEEEIKRRAVEEYLRQQQEEKQLAQQQEQQQQSDGEEK